MTKIDAYTLIIPLLRTIETKEEYKLSEITDKVFNNTNLTEEDLSIKIPNGETLFSSKLGTANMYLKKIGFIESPRFLYNKITDKGLDFLKSNPVSVSEEDLLKYPEFREYKKVFAPKDVDNETKNIFEESLKQNLSDFKEIKDKKDKNKSDNDDSDSLKSHDDNALKSVICEDIDDIKKFEFVKVFSPASELTKYADLLERGYLTKEEFESKKMELLAIKY